MDAEDLVNKAIWDVIAKIKKQDILRDIGDTAIVFGYPTKEEEKILLWLQEEKIIKLLNFSRYRRLNPPGVLPEETKLELIQSDFDKIYQEYNDFFNPKQPLNVKANQVKTKIKDMIMTKGLRGKEKLFLQTLSTMEPIPIKKVSEIVGTKHCKELKSAVQRKIRNTKLNIKTIKATELGKDSFYQLEFLTR